MNGSEQQYLDVVFAPQEPVKNWKHILKMAETRSRENKLS